MSGSFLDAVEAFASSLGWKRALAAMLVLGTASVLAAQEPPGEALDAGAGPDVVPLTLPEALRLAELDNLELQAATSQAEAAARGLEQARDQRMPALHLEAGYLRSDDPVSVFGEKLMQRDFAAADFAIDALNRPDPRDDWSSRLVLELPLWSGGRIGAGIASASARANGAGAGRERARQELVRDVAARFTGVQLAELALEAAGKSLEAATANVELVRNRREAGLVVESDLLLAQVRQSEVAELVARAEADLAVARAAFNLTLGRAQAAPVVLVPFAVESLDAIGRTGSDGAPTEPPVAEALARRPDLEAARAQAAAAQGLARAARASRRPEVGLVASVEAHAEEFFGADGDSATLAVGVRVPLFEGGRAKARAKESEAGARAAELRAKLAEQQAELEVRSRWAELEAAAQRVRLAADGAALAERSAEIVADRFRNGLTTLVDLLQSESALTSARTTTASTSSG